AAPAESINAGEKETRVMEAFTEKSRMSSALRTQVVK
nr:hypothetical protein [Tanacetum cinerariifolium]